MADPFTATAVVLAVAAAGSQVAGGIAADRAARKEANLQEDMALEASREAEADARIHAERVRKFMATQKMAYMKNGVTLEGSPMLVIEDTRRAGQEEVDAITRRGASKSRLFTEQSKQTRNQGRWAMIGGFGQAAGTLATAGMGMAGTGGGAPAARPTGDIIAGVQSGSQNPVFISNPYA